MKVYLVIETANDYETNRQVVGAFKDELKAEEEANQLTSKFKIGTYKPYIYDVEEYDVIE